MASHSSPHPLGLLGFSAAAYGALLTALRRTRNIQDDPRIELNAITDIHSVLSSAAVVYVLSRPWTVLQTPSLGPSHSDSATGLLDDSDNPLIRGRSALGNAITAWEAGYLIYDTLAVASLRYKKTTNESMLKACMRFSAKEPLTFTHHISLIVALSVLQLYVRNGRERGVWIINAFNLMNVSTPVLHWRWLQRYRTGRSDLRLDALLAMVFAGCRMVLIAWVLKTYGDYHGIGILDSFMRQRWFCQLGTGALFVMNAAWWLALVKGILRRLTTKTKKS